MREHGLGRKGALVALFLILAAVAVQSARLGASGYHAQLAHRQIGQPSIDAVEPLIRESLWYAPSNPSALELLGALELAKMRASSVPRDALAAAQGARKHYRQALLERPASPFLWVNLALSKMYLDEFDEEMFTALRHADALGPWEPSVQQASVFVGLAAWQRLDPGMRDALTRTLERAGHRNAAKTIEIVKSYGRLDLVCRLKTYQPHAARDCKT